MFMEILAERPLRGGHTRSVGPLVLLIAALTGIVFFSRGLRLIDTLGMLTCGVMAGASLASIAAGRRRAP
jgi:hypothetical protein